MGEVYLARDTRLQRAVALKVLPSESSLSPERLARLEREARMLAALNHPNIAAIHGLEEVEGTRFLVLELVEGQTLAERLQRGSIPLEETLDLGRQIANGLEAAHEKGIIHRDLKPANVKITPDGKVKILDFGLAKAPQSKVAGGDGSEAATKTDDMSRPGAILGTAAYMSPEQASGKVVDKRTDIWAFGCVLYECLNGIKAFQGETITEILAAVLKGEPDWQALPATTPWQVRNLLHRCLQKDPSERLHDIADARLELQEQMQPQSGPPGVSPLSRSAFIAAATATLVVGVLIGVAATKYVKPVASRTAQPVVRSLIGLESGHWLDGFRGRAPVGFDRPSRTAMAISSDGRFVIYSGIKENPGTLDRPRLYLRGFDQLEAKPIAGTDGGISPFLSRDDRCVGFWADRKLMKVPVEGGVPAVLCDVPQPFGFSWGEDNDIIFASNVNSGLSRISAAGGKVEMLTQPDQSRDEFAHRLPCWLPGGKGILLTITHHAWDAQPSVAVLELATRKWHVLLENAADARYVASGHLAFMRQGTLLVAPFDLRGFEITGQAVPAAANIAQALNFGNATYETAAGQFSISASGSLVYATGGILPDRQNSLVWVDHRGKAEPIASFRAPFFAPRLSPDGQRITYGILGLERCDWLYDLNRGTATKLTSEGMAGAPAWSPDGRTLAFGWLKTGVRNIYLRAVHGSSPMERLTQSDYNQYAGSWSPDGQTLAFVQEGHPETGSDILLLDIRERRVRPYLNSRFFEGYPEFSPDGRWIAFASDESGRREVYVQAFPTGGGKCQISNEGGVEPLWARDGKQVFYRWAPEGSNGPVAQVWAVDVQTGSGFSASKPRLVFEQAGFGGGTPIRCWDISPDSERFLMVKLEERKAQPLTEMVLVDNWFEEVRRLTTIKK
jgi:serine/threonine-protein kinase